MDIWKQLKNLIERIENQLGRRVKVIQIDGGKEFNPKELKAWADSKGIVVKVSALYTQAQNGKAEKYRGSIQRLSRTMCIDADIGEDWWPFATEWVVDVLNQLVKRSGISPHEYLAKELNLPKESQRPPIDHLRIFGCDTYVHIPEEVRVTSRKMAPRA